MSKVEIKVILEPGQVGQKRTLDLMDALAVFLGDGAVETPMQINAKNGEMAIAAGEAKKAELAAKRKEKREQKKAELAALAEAETADGADPEDDLMRGEVPEKTLKDVRTALSKKVGAHRPAIKAELTRLNVENVATLPKEQLGEMFEFLEAL